MLLSANNYRFYSLNFLFKCLLIIVFYSIVNSQTSIIINQQDLNFLKWNEIRSKNILSSKIGPFVNYKFTSNNLFYFYRNKTKKENIFNYNLFSEVILKNNFNPRYVINGFIELEFSENLTLHNKFEFDNQGKNDFDFQGVERGYKNGWVGYIPHSSMTYSYKDGLLSLGRGNPYFFNLNESLLINRSFPPKEYILWKHNNNWFNYDWVVVMLDGMVQNEESINRFLALHRYSINLDRLRLGFSEALICAYSKFGVGELGYLMPSAFLLETEENRGSNANLVWLFDGLYKFDGWVFNYELLIDDFAIDGLSSPRIGSSMVIGKKINNYILNIEYTYISRWTGNHCDSLQQWVENNQPIGHSVGADGKSFLINAYVDLNSQFALEVYIESMVNNSDLAPSMMEDWPSDIKCDYNMNKNIHLQYDKKIVNNYGATLYCLTNKHFYGKIDLDYTNYNLIGNISINYRFKAS